MKSIEWAFVFVVALLCQGATAKKPIMTVNDKLFQEEGISVQEEEPLKFTCTGVDGEVAITRMEIYNNRTLAEIYESQYTRSSKDPRVMVWQTSKAKSGDTGWYSCAYANVTVSNNEQKRDHSEDNIHWTYVYVNSAKKFAVENHGSIASIPIYVPEGSGAIVVPCRVTSPHLNGSVVLQSANNHTTEYIDGVKPVYLPKVGFVLEGYTPKLDEDEIEIVWCTITDGSEDDVEYHFKKPQGLKGNLTFHADSYTRNSVVGRNLTLICKIALETGDQVDHLKWTVPSRSRMGTVERRHACPKPSNSCESVWVLSNLTKDDAGGYKCTAENDKGAKKESLQVDIKIWDKPFLNCTPGEEVIDRLDATTDARWMRFIESSERPKFEWYKLGNEDELLSKYPSKFNVSQNHDKLERIFEIKNANVTDTGNYAVWVNTSFAGHRYDLRLVVQGAPDVVVKSLSMGNSLTHHKPEIDATFACIATAWPMPNITWTFTEWQAETDDPRILNLPALSQHENETFSSVESRVTMNIDMIGHLTCEACNNISCTTGTQSILISDGDGAIGIMDPGPVTEHDDLTLTCFATLLNYTGPLVWYKDDNELDPNGVNIVESKTNWTITSKLRLPDVMQKHRGIYECRAEAKNGTTSDIAKLDLVVSAESPLIFTPGTTLTNRSIRGIPSMQLKCLVTGMPLPTVTWYKNHQELSKNPDDDSCYKFIDNFTLAVNVTALSSNSNFSCVAENRNAKIEIWTYFEVDEMTGSSLTVSLVCVSIAIIMIVITWMSIRIHRERMFNRELFKAGLTHFEEGALECLNPDLTVDDQAELLPYDKKWEFPREHLKLGKQLGSGAFGVVVKAEARGICVEDEVTTVAVKMVRRAADLTYMKALTSELKIMIHLGKHLNVVNLLGACTKDILAKRELYVIVEYCRFGNLHNYLQRQRSSFINQINPATGKIDFSFGRDRVNRSTSVCSQNRSELMSVRSNSLYSNGGTEMNDYLQGQDFEEVNMSPDNAMLSDNSAQPGWRSNYRGDYKGDKSGPICTKDLVSWAWQVARGMEYLSSRNVLHGDLAARNILLAEDNIVKICDFGLAKNMYKDNNYKKKGDGPLPIKWMAVESIRDRIFSTQSDVWSFGIVLWEFFTLARTPYPSMEPAEQYQKLLEGYRMEKPEYATHEIYDLMMHCWMQKPSLRPSFPELAERFGSFLDDDLKIRYAALDTPYLNMNSEALANGQSDYLNMMSAPNHDHCYASNRALEAVSGYMPMSPIVKIDDPGIFSPRPSYQETEFRFYPPTDNVADDSNSRDRIETAAMVERNSAEGRDVGDSQSSVDDTNSNDASTAKNIKNKDLFVLTTGNQNYINMSKTVAEPQDLSTKISIDPEDLTPPIIQNPNYTNMSKKDLDPLVNGISNPNYTIMSALHEVKSFNFSSRP